jgi:hypothetical protein
LSTPDRLALLAVHRATTTSDSLQRTQALWEALEFYAAGVAPDLAFPKNKAKRARKSIPKDLDPALHKRALGLLAKINDAPVMAKIREAARRDEAPLTAADLTLFTDIRVARNDMVHGREAQVPSSSDVDYAVTLVAQLLLYRLARSS